MHILKDSRYTIDFICAKPRSTIDYFTIYDLLQCELRSSTVIVSRSVKIKKSSKYSPTFPFFQLDEIVRKRRFLLQKLVGKRRLLLSFLVSQSSITNLCLTSMKINNCSKYSPTFPFFQLDEKLRKRSFLLQKLVGKRRLLLSFLVSQSSITNLYLTSVKMKKCSKYSPTFPFSQLDEKLRKRRFLFQKLGGKRRLLLCFFWSLKALLKRVSQKMTQFVVHIIVVIIKRSNRMQIQRCRV